MESGREGLQVGALVKFGIGAFVVRTIIVHSHKITFTLS